MTKNEIIEMIEEDFEKACGQMKRLKYGSTGYCTNCAIARRLADQLDAIHNTFDYTNKVYSIDVSKAYATM